jgi:hypothetical protein
VVSAIPERRHLIALATAVCLTLAAVAGLAALEIVALPQVSLGASQDALARVGLPRFAGQVTAVDVRSAAGEPVPVQLRRGNLWPMGLLAAGERLTVELTVRRPAWASWLVGRTKSSRFTIETPRAHLRGDWVKVKAGMPPSVVFDAPVRLVALGTSPARRLARPQTVVKITGVARGAESAGAIRVAAAARSWERLPAPILVRWFAARPYPQVMVDPAPAARLAPDGRLTLTFSDSIKTVLGKSRPKVSPTVPGRWTALDAYTLAFQPSGYGFGLGSTARIELPVAVHLAGQTGAKLTRKLQWRVPPGSTVRLEQLLAQLGYIPLDWRPTGEPVTATPAAQLAAAVSPPPGTFSWRYPSTPKELQVLWHVAGLSKITYGAVMLFEETHGMPADGLAGPKVWSLLIADAIAGKSKRGGYNYVFVHRAVPQVLSLWHDGRVIFTSPGNTGVDSAPTALGTYPVFEHIAVGTMSGTNPSGSHYSDPGIRWISYFNGGDALHAFDRASFGTPQSVGCVELPLAAAAKLWPYTPIGTLVTIEK